MKPRWFLNGKHKHEGGAPRAPRTVIVCTPKLKPAEEALHGNKRETLKETIKINARPSTYGTHFGERIHGFIDVCGLNMQVSTLQATYFEN